MRRRSCLFGVRATLRPRAGPARNRMVPRGGSARNVPPIAFSAASCREIGGNVDVEARYGMNASQRIVFVPRGRPKSSDGSLRGVAAPSPGACGQGEGGTMDYPRPAHSYSSFFGADLFKRKGSLHQCSIECLHRNCASKQRPRANFCVELAGNWDERQHH